MPPTSFYTVKQDSASESASGEREKKFKSTQGRVFIRSIKAYQHAARLKMKLNTTTLSTEVAKIPEASFCKNSFKVPLNYAELHYYFSPPDSPVKFYFFLMLNEHTPMVKYGELRRANMCDIACTRSRGSGSSLHGAGEQQQK